MEHSAARPDRPRRPGPDSFCTSAEDPSRPCFVSLQCPVTTISSRSPAKLRAADCDAETNTMRRLSWWQFPRSIWICCSSKTTFAQSGDNNAGRNAASDPGMVRLHERQDPGKFGERSREDTQYDGRRAGGAFDTRSRQSLSVHPDPRSGRARDRRGRSRRISIRSPRNTSGKDKYPYGRPGEVRVIFEIEPTAVQVMG